ncbi:MAG: methyltransferase domain-containing protein [Pseudomonadota bacterium]
MDLFGKALLSFYHGQSDANIKVVRDDGWEDAHSPGLYFQQEPFDFEKPALGLLNGPTIDVGCGAGRHLGWLRQQGYEAYGLDNSAGAIEVRRAQGFSDTEVFDVMSDKTPTVPFAIENISLFGNNVGIGGTFDGSRALLRNLHGLCREGARLVLTGLNIRDTKNAQHIAYQDRNVAAGRRRGELKIRLSYEGEIGPEFAWFHPEPEEIEELGSSTGWKIEKLERLGGFFWASLRCI